MNDWFEFISGQVLILGGMATTDFALSGEHFDFRCLMSKNISIAGDGQQLSRTQATPVRILIRFDGKTKVRGIHGRFHGAEKTEATYTETTTDSNGDTKTETKTATEYVDIVKQDFLLFGNERMGFFARLIDSFKTWMGGGNHVMVEAVEREFSVSLKIPGNAPESFKGRKCQVFYKLNVCVDVPIKMDWSHTHEFAVTPEESVVRTVNPVHVVYPDAAGRSLWDRTFGKDVKLNLAVDRDTMSVGEKALAMLTVESPEPLKVDDMEISLVGTETSEAHGHKDSHVYRHSLGKIDSPKIITGESVHEFDILIPAIDGPCSCSGAKFDISWAIEVQLKIPWAKDPTIRAPVRIVPGPKTT